MQHATCVPLKFPNITLFHATSFAQNHNKILICRYNQTVSVKQKGDSMTTRSTTSSPGPGQRQTRVRTEPRTTIKTRPPARVEAEMKRRGTTETINGLTLGQMCFTLFLCIAIPLEMMIAGLQLRQLINNSAVDQGNLTSQTAPAEASVRETSIPQLTKSGIYYLGLRDVATFVETTIMGSGEIVLNGGDQIIVTLPPPDAQHHKLAVITSLGAGAIETSLYIGEGDFFEAQLDEVRQSEGCEPLHNSQIVCDGIHLANLRIIPKQSNNLTLVTDYPYEVRRKGG